MSYNDLRDNIRDNISSNNNHEITGEVLQEVLLDMVEQMEDGDKQIEDCLEQCESQFAQLSGDLEQTKTDLQGTKDKLEETRLEFAQKDSEFESRLGEISGEVENNKRLIDNVEQTSVNNTAEIDVLKKEVNNRYTKQEVDGKEHKLRQEIEDEFAKKNGTYPKMTVGFAQEIVGDGSATPEEFSFRPTAGEDRNVANTTYYEGERNGVARIEKVKGNSVVWNQLLGHGTLYIGEGTGTIPSGDYPKTFTVSGVEVTLYETGEIALSGTATERVTLRYENPQYTNKTNDIQFFKGFASSSVNTYWFGGLSSGQRDFKGLFEVPSIYNGNNLNPAIRIYSGVTINETITPAVYIFTQMFGAGNEPTTVEEFYQRLPKGIDINAYNKGEIIDGNYGAIKTVGFNAFNGTYAKVCAGCPYYLGGNYTSLGFANEEGGTYEAITLPTSVESVGTTPSDRLYTPEENGFIYAEGENININLSWDTEYGYLNGTYQSYKPFNRDLSWMNKYLPNGMRSAGSVRDEIRFNSTTQKWEAVQNVGVRAYAEGDAEDTSVTTDGTNTNYALTTPDVAEIEEMPNMDFDVSDYGTEELIVVEGAQSAPLVADITYAPNALSTIKQVPDILKRLKALESVVAQQTTNVEPSNIEE